MKEERTIRRINRFLSVREHARLKAGLGKDLKRYSHKADRRLGKKEAETQALAYTLEARERDRAWSILGNLIEQAQEWGLY